ncbi:MAG TPA: hypothetical protein VLG44_04575 [Chlamydiales bacterium]|nr:hypothetical protein [Chlamydiales bacterium]
MNPIDYKNISIADLASLVNEKFNGHGIKTVLVGGACVAIYSNNRYLSYDLDFVTFEMSGKIKKVLSELGFELKGKYFSRSDCPFFIEFVSPPIAVGDELVKKFKVLHTPFGQIELLTPTDCVKDRLASFFHWNDRQALEQALMVYQDQKVNLKELERWAKAENHLDKFKDFLKLLKRKKE